MNILEYYQEKYRILTNAHTVTADVAARQLEALNFLAKKYQLHKVCSVERRGYWTTRTVINALRSTGEDRDND